MSDPKPVRLLLVDDEPALVEYIVELFEDEGFEVTAETSGAGALARVQAEPNGFDIVITDQTMPALLGTDLARAIRGVNPAIPIMLCTGYSDHLAEASLAEGIVDHVVQKPIRALALIEEVGNLLK